MKESNLKKYLIGLFVLVLVLIGLMAGFIYLTLKEPAPSGTAANSIEYEDAAKETGKTSVEAITSKINEMVEEGMIRISINPTPEFESSEAEGTVNIVNHTSNLYPQIVEIKLDETGETLYKSKAIPVGHSVERINLNLTEPLAAGTYDCTAYFTAVEAETGSPVGTAGAKLKLKVIKDGGDSFED